MFPCQKLDWGENNIAEEADAYFFPVTLAVIVLFLLLTFLHYTCNQTTQFTQQLLVCQNFLYLKCTSGVEPADSSVLILLVLRSASTPSISQLYSSLQL